MKEPIEENGGLSVNEGNAKMSMPYGNDQSGEKIDAFNELRNVGDIVQCATEGCTNTFQVRTTWHKYCPECRAKKDAPYAQRKRKGTYRA